MNNKYVITSCRFHVKNANRLFVDGWFYENQMGDNQLKVYVDDKEALCTVEEKRRMMGDLRNKEGLVITKQYQISVYLPEDWRQGKNLIVVNSEGDTDDVACKIPVSKLLKSEKKVPKFVDHAIVGSEEYKISGWYIDIGDSKLQFFAMDGKELFPTIERKKRPDVKRVYPEVEEDEIIGFMAKFNGIVPKKIRVHFEMNGKQTDYVMPLIESALEKKIKKIEKVYRKTKKHYHEFGAKETILKVMDKLKNRDSITYKEWYKRHCPSKEMLRKQCDYKFAYEPKISIVIPLYKTPENYLNELVESIKNQTYSNWELCLSDGSGENSPLLSVLRQHEEQDKRIKVVYNKTALQISENTNAALDISTGDFIAFADHDDLLAPNALFECVKALNEDPSVEIIYTDEDKIDMKGKEHFMPHFKSDFNIDMLRCNNYICHLFVVKRNVYECAGQLNSEFDGAQDYDFVLRCVETGAKIKHIPKILYHWRAHKDSTAENPESKNYAFIAGKRAVQAHYDRIGIKAIVEETEQKGIYRSKYVLDEEPLISIIIANKDHSDDLDKCISALEKKSTYKNYEIIVVENNSTEEKTFAYYRELEEKYPRAKVVFWEGKGFNYPAINNYGVTFANGDYVLFLNNDTEIVNEDCLFELMGYCMRDDVGAVGARMYYEDGTIQHAGVIIGLGGIAGHAFVGAGRESWGYFGRICLAQNYSAVTAACLLMKKSVFEEVGGFDEGYAVAFNDVDLCLKVRRAGYLIVYNPYAELNHYESKSRGYEDTEEKIQRFQSEIDLFKERWGDFLMAGDPYYSPNLTLDKNDFSLNVQINKVGV